MSDAARTTEHDQRILEAARRVRAATTASEPCRSTTYPNMCATCAYWQRCPTQVDHDGNEMICGFSRNAAGGFHGQDGRAVITPADFGCIQWAAKKGGAS
jgi:hypothetical protein